MWIGPTASVIVSKPEHIKEVLNRNYDFPKPPLHPIVELFATGFAVYEGEKWSKHRKIINPSFHLEKLKVFLTPNSHLLKLVINLYADFISFVYFEDHDTFLLRELQRDDK